MNRLITTLVIAVALCCPGGAAMAIEEPDYEVLLVGDDIEIRRYEPYLVAEVTVPAKSADRNAFRILAGYIFGDNEGDVKMQMTAPVESRGHHDTQRETQEFAFVMEKSYSLDTLPKPDDDRVQLRQKPARIVAVRQFSGRWSDANISKHEQQLLEDLRGLGIDVKGPPELARYNSPFTPWFLRRNEIIVPVDWEDPVGATIIAAEAAASL